MTHAVRAGRVLAFAIAIGCIAIFAALSRLIVRDWRVALLATFAFALSGGIAVHLRILRSELVAACPVIFALMLLIAIGRRAHVARPLGLALASALCVLGLENKVQAILLIGVLPVLILPFGGPQSTSAGFWRTGAPGSRCSIAAIVAIAAAWTAWPLIIGRPRPQPARFSAIPSAAAQPLRHLSMRAARPDRRLHDRLRRDLADQRS